MQIELGTPGGRGLGEKSGVILALSTPFTVESKIAASISDWSDEFSSS
jgi:hypothetical protein